MVSVSNYSYEPSLTRRSAVGKPPIEDAPVGAVIAAKLKLMLEDIEWLQDTMRAMLKGSSGSYDSCEHLHCPERLKTKEFVNLVVTSPPYLNNYHLPAEQRSPNCIGWVLLQALATMEHTENESFGKFLADSSILRANKTVIRVSSTRRNY